MFLTIIIITTLRRLSAPTSGSARRRARERQLAEKTRIEGERLARERREKRAREKFELQKQVNSLRRLFLIRE